MQQTLNATQKLLFIGPILRFFFGPPDNFGVHLHKCA